MDKARHAFGALENVDVALSENKIDSFDILFVKDADGKPYVGWISRDGQKEILDPYSGVVELETQLMSEIETKASAEEVETIKTQMDSKVDTTTVETMVETAVTEAVAEAVGTEVVEF